MDFVELKQFQKVFGGDFRFTIHIYPITDKLPHFHFPRQLLAGRIVILYYTYIPYYW